MYVMSVMSIKRKSEANLHHPTLQQHQQQFFWELKCLRLSIMAPTRTPKQRPVDIATRPNGSTQGRQVMNSSHKHHCYVVVDTGHSVQIR